MGRVYRKWLRSVLVAALLSHSHGTWALCSTDGIYSTGDAAVDLFVFRPLGVVTTIAGTAVFIAGLPFIGLASIAPPHQAAAVSSELLVMRPAAWTFVRPFANCKAMGYDNW